MNNKSIHISELKADQIAIIVDWPVKHFIGTIVQYVNHCVCTVGLKDNVNVFHDAMLPTDVDYIVRVLHPETTFKLTENGLTMLSEPEEPLFISEDGELIFENTTIYNWSTKLEQPDHRHDGKLAKTLGEHTYKNPETGWKIFKSKEKRDEYANKHKTRLITDDGVKLKVGDTYWRVNKRTFNTSITQCRPYMIISDYQYDKFTYFSSKEKAEEYVKLMTKSEHNDTDSDTIEFMEWVAKNGWEFGKTKWIKSLNSGDVKSSKELYDLWKSTKK